MAPAYTITCRAATNGAISTMNKSATDSRVPMSDTAARKASLKNTTPIPKPTAPMAAMANVTCSPIGEHRRVVLIKDLHAVLPGDMHGVIDNGRVNGGKGRALGVRVAHLQ